jgi:hypothetical protein
MVKLLAPQQPGISLPRDLPLFGRERLGQMRHVKLIRFSGTVRNDRVKFVPELVARESSTFASRKAMVTSAPASNCNW